MDMIIILLPLGAFIAAIFVFLFVRAVRTGQYEDLEDAARRILDDDDAKR